jgi:predicted PurR-regulated permease PerM
VWVLVATGIIQFVENVWLVPRIMNHSMGVNPVVTLLSLVTFSSVLGFAGGILALPLAALIQLTLDRLTDAAAGIETGAVRPRPTRRAEVESIVRDVNLLLSDLEAE